MKSAKWPLLVALVALTMTAGCNTPVSAPVGAPRDAATFPIVTAQDDAVGTVEAWSDGEYLYVRFTVDEYSNWFLTETRVAVANDYYGLPQTRTGDPKLDDFTFRATHNRTKTYTHALPHDYSADQVIAIATHCSLVKVSENAPVEQEAGSSGNRDFAGSSRARWFEYTFKVEDARHEGNASCWAGDSAQGPGAGTKWYRWTEYIVGGGAVEVPMYAGQSHHCGTLDIWETAGCLHIRFACSGESYREDYKWAGFNVTQLNVATERAAAFLNNNAAPGQFDYRTDLIPRRMSYVYDISSIWPTGTKLYIFAHGDVAYALSAK